MISKKLRSKLPRRKRTPISPIHTESSNSVLLNDKLPQFSAVQADSSSSSCFPGEISSSLPTRSRQQKRNYDVAFEVTRPVTRSYLKQIEGNQKVVTGIELSESSCIESTIGISAPQIEVSEASTIQPNQIQTSFNEASTISVQRDEPSVDDVEFSVDQQQKKKLNVDDVEFSVDQQQQKKVKVDDFADVDEYSLACSENLSFGDDSEHNTSLYELDSDFFTKSSSLEFSDFSPSMLDELTQESDSDDSESPPPIYFPFYLEYQKQFTTLTSSASAQVHEEFNDQFTLMRFENVEYEESYMKFRGRERQLELHDFGEEYSSTSQIGDLVLQQRILMVNWIVEQSESQKLQSETMFLGVSLMDRFLSRGYFTQKKKLQLLGIACLTLATRLEENQPFNSVRRSAFYVGKSVYTRSEVIGMEWLVQEVLNFHCYLPTVYNFLWFYLKAAKANVEVEKRTKYLAVLSLVDHERLVFWPSTVAAGLVILASLAANQDYSCQWVMETHVRTKDDDLPECIQSLEWLVKYVC